MILLDYLTFFWLEKNKNRSKMSAWEGISLIINHVAQRNNYNNIILHLQRTYDLTKICSRTISKRLRSVFLILCFTGIFGSAKYRFFFKFRTKSVIHTLIIFKTISKQQV